jgi:hypothetical protein
MYNDITIQGDDRYFDLRASLGYEGLKDDVARYLADGQPLLTCVCACVRASI